MKLSELRDGTLFRFADRQQYADSRHIYVARGNRWYDAPNGYAGGPWCRNTDDPEVIITGPIPKTAS